MRRLDRLSHDQEIGARIIDDNVLKLLEINGYINSKIDNYNFDLELFEEYNEDLSRRLERASDRDRRKMLVEFYFDSIAPGIERSESKYLSESAMMPPELRESSLESLKLVSSGSIDKMLGDENNFTRYVENEFFQYGPSRIMNVLPGNFIDVQLDKNDVLGTSGLSACQVLYAKKDERIIMAHSLYGAEIKIPKIIKEIKNRLGDNTLVNFVYPKIVVGPQEIDEEPDIEDMAEKNNSFFQDITQENEMISHPYYYVRPSYNPKNIGETTILMTKYGVNMIETNMQWANNSKWKKQLIEIIDVISIENGVGE